MSEIELSERSEACLRRASDILRGGHDYAAFGISTRSLGGAAGDEDGVKNSSSAAPRIVHLISADPWLLRRRKEILRCFV